MFLAGIRQFLIFVFDLRQCPAKTSTAHRSQQEKKPLKLEVNQGTYLV